jgi:hypothetical protein
VDGKLRWGIHNSRHVLECGMFHLGRKLWGVGEAFIALSAPAASPSPVRMDNSLRAQIPGHCVP